MTILEIILLAAGALLIAASFFIKVNDDVDSDITNLVKEEVKRSIDEESENMRKHVDDVVNEAVTYAEEKTERALERVCNEKIMAVNEYSDTVLEEINKNHKEVMFLYDMLNDKQDNIKESIKIADEAAANAQKSAEELSKRADEAQKTAEDLDVKAAEAKAVSVKASPISSSDNAAVSSIQIATGDQAGDSGELVSGSSEVLYDPVKHSSQKAINFFSELALDEAIATVQSVPDNAGEKKVRTLNWAELAVNDANEAEKKEAVKEGREPEKIIDGPQERLNKEVIELADSGLNEMEIARRLKMGVGEVSLILGLHSK